MKRILLVTGVLSLLIGTGCLVREVDGGHGYRHGHGSYHHGSEVIVGPPVVVVRPPEVIIR